MPFARPSLTDLVDRTHADLATRLTLVGSGLRRSVVGILARVLAGAAHLLHGHLEFIAKQIFPDTSEVEYLERQARLFGLTRTAATYASGTVTLSGIDGSDVPSGTLLQRADGAQYATTADTTIAAGVAAVAVEAVLAGAAGNADAGVALTVVSPLPGVQATGTVAGGGLLAGADAESDDALRSRLLTRMRQPPHGGAAADYVTWATAVPGVTRAWVYPQELGAGTVSVRFVRDGDGPGAAIIPSVGEVAAVQAYIDARRPVTAAVTVVAPVSVALNLTVHIVPDSAEIRAAVQAELADLLARDAVPGGTILLSQLQVAVGTAAGVTNFTIASPSADVTHTTGQIATLGTITWV